MFRQARHPTGCISSIHRAGPARYNAPVKEAWNAWLLCSVCCLTTCSSLTDPVVRVSGHLSIWRPVTLTVDGPSSSESGEINPFTDYRMTVTFSHEGTRRIVPGFFAADGKAAETSATSGNQWRAFFVPDKAGTWNYQISFRQGSELAWAEGAESGQAVEPVHGIVGTLEVAPVSDSGDSSEPRGLLQYVGRRYLQYAGTGDYFIKSGTDSPENFLAFEDFDGDRSRSPGTRSPRTGEAETAPLHRYEPHIQDWTEGDPTWQGGKGKGMIGALNYLAAQGVNSVYFLTMNIAGDGDDVWPYTSREERFRFDCSKLDQWNVVFDHMDRLGIMLHVVLSETENESLFEVEEQVEPFANSRKIYYRELVARFAHHTALVWNIGEENGWNDRDWDTTSPQKRALTHDQRKAFADYIRSVDPYDRPIVVHTLPGRYDEIYLPLLGHPSYEGPSLQISPVDGVHAETIRWIERSEQAGRPWVVCLDEIGPADTGVKPDSQDPDHDDVRRFGLWGNLMAGGAGCEWYFGYQYPDNDLNLENFRSREEMWHQTRIAVEFFQTYLPFHQMNQADDLIHHPSGYCFAQPGQIYAVYMGTGGSSELWLPEASYSIRWFDPRNGGDLKEGTVSTVSGGGFRSLGAPPHDKERDWVALVRLEGPAPARITRPPEG